MLFDRLGMACSLPSPPSPSPKSPCLFVRYILYARLISFFPPNLPKLAVLCVPLYMRMPLPFSATTTSSYRAGAITYGMEHQSLHLSSHLMQCADLVAENVLCCRCYTIGGEGGRGLLLAFGDLSPLLFIRSDGQTGFFKCCVASALLYFYSLPFLLQHAVQYTLRTRALPIYCKVWI